MFGRKEKRMVEQMDREYGAGQLMAVYQLPRFSSKKARQGGDPSDPRPPLTEEDEDTLRRIPDRIKALGVSHDDLAQRASDHSFWMFACDVHADDILRWDEELSGLSTKQDQLDATARFPEPLSGGVRAVRGGEWLSGAIRERSESFGPRRKAAARITGPCGGSTPTPRPDAPCSVPATRGHGPAAAAVPIAALVIPAREILSSAPEAGQSVQAAVQEGKRCSESQTHTSRTSPGDRSPGPPGGTNLTHRARSPYASQVASR
jgi:hypothetical protein